VKNYTFVDYTTQAYSAFVAVLVLSFHNGTVPLWKAVTLAHCAGVVLTHLLIQAWAANPRNRVLDFLRHFYPVIFYTWFFCETGSLNRMFFSSYLDPLLIQVEQSLFHCQPGLLLMDHLPYVWLSELLYASYFSYYVMIAGVGIALYVRNRRQFFHYVSVISFVFYACYTTYIFVPVIGPRLFFGEMEGYRLPPELLALADGRPHPVSIQNGPMFHIMGWIYDNFETPGAAFPSSHVALSLATVVFSFLYLPRVKWIHLTFACLLCVSTVYCRYHYGIDVIAGVLTAAALVPLGHWLYFKFHRQAAKESVVLTGAQAQVGEQ
jgi:membrane-associated phospholipid phosphatase